MRGFIEKENKLDLHDILKKMIVHKGKISDVLFCNCKVFSLKFTCGQHIFSSTHSRCVHCTLVAPIIVRADIASFVVIAE